MGNDLLAGWIPKSLRRNTSRWSGRAPDNAFRLSARPAEGACLPPRWRSPTGWSRSERTASARTSAH